MKIQKFDHSNDNPVLAPLTTLKGEPNSWKNMPTKAIKGDDFETLQKVYLALTGQNEVDFDGTETFYRLQFDNAGNFRKYFSPAVYKADPENPIEALEGHNYDAIIRWGNTFIPLQVIDGAIKSVHAPSAKFAITVAKIGRYDEKALKVSLIDADSDKLYVLEFPLKFEDWKNTPEIDALTAMYDMGQGDAIIAMLYKAKTGSGGGTSDVNGMSVLPLGEPVSLVAKASRKRADGSTTYILTDTEGKNWWATSNAVNLLDAGALCDTENPFIVVRSEKNGKNAYNYDVQWPEQGLSLDLDWANS